jgi:general stress protein 26
VLKFREIQAIEGVKMLPELTIPQPQPPRDIPGYKLPQVNEQLLTWDFVARQADQAKYYWLATVSPSGQPHTVPVWGIWYMDRVHFEGSPQTRWARNLAQNTNIAVHLPDGEQVVIIEGKVQMIGDDELTSEEWNTLDSAYREKYSVLHGSPYYVVHPKKVLAWDTPSLATMTRWVFE